MKSNYSIYVIIGLLALAFITNPGTQKHKDAVKEKISEAMNAEMKKNEMPGGEAGAAIGSAFGGALIDGIVNNLVSSDNYFVCSTTKVTFQGETKVIGIGLFGMVFLSDKLDEKLNTGN